MIPSWHFFPHFMSFKSTSVFLLWIGFSFYITVMHKQHLGWQGIMEIYLTCALKPILFLHHVSVWFLQNKCSCRNVRCLSVEVPCYFISPSPDFFNELCRGFFFFLMNVLCDAKSNYISFIFKSETQLLGATLVIQIHSDDQPYKGWVHTNSVKQPWLCNCCKAMDS